MKTKEQRKAELLDRWIASVRQAIDFRHETSFYEKMLLEEYDEIESEKTLQQDPYADEVFGGRVSNILRDYCRLNNRVDTLRLSQCPRISTLIKYTSTKEIRGFGYKSWQEYREVMTKYGFTDKLT